jgi:hypothetical protein
MGPVKFDRVYKKAGFTTSAETEGGKPIRKRLAHRIANL